MWLFLIFLAVPLIEIGLFIEVGGAIGLWPTLAIVVITAIVGTFLVKSQGLNTLTKLRTPLAGDQEPTALIADGVMVLFAGALLLTPGFFTDALGFGLLTPGVRRMIFAALSKRIHIHQASFVSEFSHAPAYGHQHDIVDGDFREVTDDKDTPGGP